MAFNFPNSPSDGTVFTPSGGPTYTFSGGVWKLSGGGSGFVVVSDTAPSTPFPGMLWWESDTGALWFWFVDANSSQWVQINFTPTGVATAETRNRIVNGAMQISQENGVAGGTTNNYFPADQWFAQISGIASTSAKSSATTHQILIQATTGKTLAASDFLAFGQTIEGLRVWDFGYGAAGALPSVLRFEVYSNITGTFGGSLRNTAANRSFTFPFTVPTANVWTVISIPIPGDTTGTWAIDNTSGMILSITFASGATFLSPAPGWQAGNFLAPPGITNGAAVTGNTLYLRNVGLHLDPLATGMPPAWTMPDEAQELAACMRYYYVTGAPQTNVYHYGPASGFMDAGSIPFVVTMRTNPASAITTAPSMTNCSAPIASAISNGATLYVTVATLGGYLANGGIYSFNARM